MPNRPIDFKFTADVVRLLNGLDKAELSVEDLEQAFVEASNSSEDLEKKINRATKEAERDVEKLERAVRDIPKATDDMADEAVKDFSRVGEEAKETGREAGQNFSQSLGEGLSSGDTSEVVQEVLGEAVGNMSGPVSAAVGVLAGGALLIFNKVREEWEKTQEAIKSQTASMWGTILGDIEGKVGESFARINKQTVITEELDRLWNEDPEGMLKLVDASEELGVSARDVVRARAGDEEALKKVKAQVDGILTTMDLTTAESVDQIDAARQIQAGWKISEEAVGKAKSMVEGYNESVGDVLTTIARIPSTIPITIKVDKSSLNEFSGGAYALSGGGRLNAVYGPKAGSSG
jgi:BMFP domain-containing protein YqiC